MGQWNVRSDRCLFHTNLFEAMCLLALSSFPLPGMMTGGRIWSSHFGHRGGGFVIRKAEGHYQCWLAHLPLESYKGEKQSSVLLDTTYVGASVLPDCTKLKCQCPGYPPCAFRLFPLCSISWVVDHYDNKGNLLSGFSLSSAIGNYQLEIKGERRMRMVSLPWVSCLLAKHNQCFHSFPGDHSSCQMGSSPVAKARAEVLTPRVGNCSLSLSLRLVPGYISSSLVDFICNLSLHHFLQFLC